jgi:hypothetical protein
MITPANITTARRLLATWHDVRDLRRAPIAKDRKPYLAWLHEAKPVAGFDPRSRPVGGLVVHSLAEQVKRYDARAAHKASANPIAEVPDIGGDDNNGKPLDEITEADITSTLVKILDDTLPTPPAVITVHIRPGRAEEIADASTVADYNAARSPIAVTARTLRQHEAELREKAKRHAAFVGVDDEARRMLNIAAHLHEAAKLLDPNATPDEING